MSGISAQYVDGLELRIKELGEQVALLTKERDALRSRRCEVCGYLEHEREHTGCLREQLAALAEQNEKLKAERSSVWMVATKVCMMLFATKEDADQSQSQQGASTYTVPVEVPVFGAPLHDLASPVLNRIRAEGMRMAADLLGNAWNRGECDPKIAIRARADELEKSNGL